MLRVFVNNHPLKKEEFILVTYWAEGQHSLVPTVGCIQPTYEIALECLVLMNKAHGVTGPHRTSSTQGHYFQDQET